MKILQVYHIYPDLFGGVATVCYQLTNELKKMGQEVEVLSTHSFINEKTRHYDDEIIVHRFDLFSNYLYKNNILVPSLNYIKWVKKNIHGYDVIHIHDYRNIYNLIIMHYARKYNIPYILQTHGGLPSNGKKKTLKILYDVIFGRTLLSNASKILALNKVEVDELNKRIIEK